MWTREHVAEEEIAKDRVSEDALKWATERERGWAREWEKDNHTKCQNEWQRIGPEMQCRTRSSLITCIECPLVWIQFRVGMCVRSLYECLSSGWACDVTYNSSEWSFLVFFFFVRVNSPNSFDLSRCTGSQYLQSSKSRITSIFRQLLRFAQKEKELWTLELFLSLKTLQSACQSDTKRFIFQTEYCGLLSVGTEVSRLFQLLLKKQTSSTVSPKRQKALCAGVRFFIATFIEVLCIDIQTLGN